MKVTDFDYDLPEELIAQHPVEPRDTSRLLTLDKITGEYTHKAHFYDLLDELQAGDVLVFNNTKVIQLDYMVNERVPVARWRFYYLHHVEKIAGNVSLNQVRNVRLDRSSCLMIG